MEIILQLFVYHKVTRDIFNEAISKHVIVFIKIWKLSLVSCLANFLYFSDIFIFAFSNIQFKCLSGNWYIISFFNYVMFKSTLTVWHELSKLVKKRRRNSKVQHFYFLAKGIKRYVITLVVLLCINGILLSFIVSYLIHTFLFAFIKRRQWRKVNHKK